MIPKDIRIVKDDIDRQLLPVVRKPGRYIGGEVNQVKNLTNAVPALATILGWIEQANKMDPTITH